MPINYLCIDDAPEADVAPLLELLKRSKNTLKFSFEYPREFDACITDIRKKSPDGILLDLRLDDVPNPMGKKINYRAVSLAQEIRTRMTEGKIPPAPIALWSVDRNYEKSYNKDKSAHDIFDAIYCKGDFSTDYKSIAEELIDLVEGYSQIKNNPKSGNMLYKALGFSAKTDLTHIDPRIENEFNGKTSHPVHTYAQFILNKFLKYTGPVIDEDTLAARLGVDRKSSADWTKLSQQLLRNAKYSGAFSATNPRWWMHLVDSWWYKLAKGQSLRGLGASDRVALLKKTTKLKKLKAAKPLMKDYSDRFWVSCKISKTPLDPKDGVMISTSQSEWQDREYLSLHSVLEREHKNKFTIHPLEVSRISSLVRKHKNG